MNIHWSIDWLAALLCAAACRRSSSTDSRVKRGFVTSAEGIPHHNGVIITSSSMSSSMPHLSDKPGTSQYSQSLNHIYRSSSVALAGCAGDVVDDDVAMVTRKRWAGRQGRHHGVMTSEDTVMEHSYWLRHRQSASATSNSRFALSIAASSAWVCLCLSVHKRLDGSTSRDCWGPIIIVLDGVPYSPPARRWRRSCGTDFAK